MSRDTQSTTPSATQRDGGKRRFPSFLTIRRPVLKWNEPWGATAQVAKDVSGHFFKQGLIYSSLLMGLALIAVFLRGGEAGGGIDGRIVLYFLAITFVLSLLYPAAAFVPGYVRLYADCWIVYRGGVGQAFPLESLQECLLTTCEWDGKTYPVLQGWSRSGSCAFQVFWRDSLSEAQLASTLAEWDVRLRDVREVE